MTSPRADALLLALALDWTVGEPPTPVHPVVWLGSLIGWLERAAPPQTSPALQLAYGAGMTTICTSVAMIPPILLRAPHPLLAAMLLKPTFAWKTLHQAASRVAHALMTNDIAAARQHLQWLVSRDPTQLDSALVAAATIESLAENASDSVVAPLVAYALFGIPGAYAYRAINTLDAMIGYRGDYEYLGKVAARLDDLVNIVPSRLTALLIVVAAALCGEQPANAWHTLWRDGNQTQSPNAGYPMSALAGALNIRLEKVDHYCLNAHAPLPTPDHINRAARVIWVALALASGLLSVSIIVRSARQENYQ